MLDEEFYKTELLLAKLSNRKKELITLAKEDNIQLSLDKPCSDLSKLPNTTPDASGDKGSKLK